MNEEKIFRLNIQQLAQCFSQNKFYLYKQKMDKWKKNNTNYMNMQEEE